VFLPKSENVACQGVRGWGSNFTRRFEEVPLKGGRLSK